MFSIVILLVIMDVVLFAFFFVVRFVNEIVQLLNCNLTWPGG